MTISLLATVQASVTINQQILEKLEKFVLNIDTTGKFGTETVVVKVLANTSDEYYILRVDMNIVDNHDSKKHKKTL